MLKQPYPFLYNTKRTLIILAIVSIVIFIINYLINDDKVVIQHFHANRLTFSLAFGAITAFFIWLVFDVLPRLFFTEALKEKWTLGREAALLAGLFALIIFFNYLFLLISARDFHLILQVKTFLIVVIQGVLIGFVPALLAVLINYLIFLRKNLQQVKMYNAQLLEEKTSESSPFQEEKITITSNNKNETIEFLPSQLCFVKSEGNYTEFYTWEEETLKKSIYRISIQAVEEALAEFPQIKRIHRCYLANLQKVKSYQGNARNFQLCFADDKTMAPVSRSKFHEIQDYMDVH